MDTAAAALSKPQIIVHIEKLLNYTVFDAKWIPCSAKFVVVGSHPRDTGALEVYELSKGELKCISKVRRYHFIVLILCTGLWIRGKNQSPLSVQRLELQAFIKDTWPLVISVEN